VAVLSYNMNMAENTFSNNIEAEIAQLSQEIEAKRRLLEESKGIVEEREVLGEVVAEKVGVKPDRVVASTGQPTASSGASPATQAKKDDDSYLAGLPPETIAIVNSLILAIPRDGINKTIARAQQEHPLILDAFHDALVTHLYAEMKDRGIIK
jgi:hypothetical protein